MLEKWRKMSPGDRLRVQILILFGLVAVYAPFYVGSSGRLFEAEKMLSRRKDRIEKRASLGKIAGGGPNLRTMENRIGQVEEQLKEVSAAFGKLDARFAPVDSDEVQQKLMLDLSTLAERTGVDLVSISRRGISPEGKATTANAPVDRALGRPLIDVTAKARFGALFNFLNELETLPFHVCVVNLKLYTKDPKNERGSAQGDTSAGELHVQLLMTL